MCGVFGYAGHATNMPKLESFMRVLAIETSERGTDATGFAALLDDGKFVGSKAAMPANKFVFADPVFDRVFESKPRLMIGHCRLATHGKKEDNKNNHPHMSKDRMLSIVHNGIVFAHDHLAQSIGAVLRSECDSEVILRMVEDAIPVGEKKCYDKLVNVAQELEDWGAMFSVLTLDKSRRCIWSFRNYTNPLVYWESEQLGVTVFASELAHIAGAARIVLGKKASKSINAFSPEPGRVFRFSDRGTVKWSRLGAQCSEERKARTTASSFGWNAMMGDDADIIGASCGYSGGKYGSSAAKIAERAITRSENITPHAWQGNTVASDVGDDLPHTQYCICSLCSTRRANSLTHTNNEKE